jgi:hypothetical protein
MPKNAVKMNTNMVKMAENMVKMNKNMVKMVNIWPKRPKFGQNATKKVVKNGQNYMKIIKKSRNENRKRKKGLKNRQKSEIFGLFMFFILILSWRLVVILAILDFDKKRKKAPPNGALTNAHVIFKTCNFQKPKNNKKTKISNVGNKFLGFSGELNLGEKSKNQKTGPSNLVKQIYKARKFIKSRKILKLRKNNVSGFYKFIKS